MGVKGGNTVTGTKLKGAAVAIHGRGLDVKNVAIEVSGVAYHVLKANFGKYASPCCQLLTGNTGTWRCAGRSNVAWGAASEFLSAAQRPVALST